MELKLLFREGLWNAQELYLRMKFYLRLPSKDYPQNTFIFFLRDGYAFRHPGLCDRLKAIVGGYYIAKTNGMDYKIAFDASFRLEDYLVPNSVDWRIDEKKITYSWPQVKLFKYNPKRAAVEKLHDRTKQYHCYLYSGIEHPAMMVSQSEWKHLWHECFTELFQPSEYLRQLLSSVERPSRYFAIHFRFVNALEKFEKGYDSNLSDGEKQKLIEACLKAADEIAQKEDCEALLFSDSALFLHIAEKCGYHVLSADNIGHISFTDEKEIMNKTFLDLYTMSRAEKVYSVRGKLLYASVFSKYAAIIGDVPYEYWQLPEE